MLIRVTIRTPGNMSETQIANNIDEIAVMFKFNAETKMVLLDCAIQGVTYETDTYAARQTINDTTDNCLQNQALSNMDLVSLVTKRQHIVVNDEFREIDLSDPENENMFYDETYGKMKLLTMMIYAYPRQEGNLYTHHCLMTFKFMESVPPMRQITIEDVENFIYGAAAEFYSEANCTLREDVSVMQESLLQIVLSINMTLKITEIPADISWT